MNKQKLSQEINIIVSKSNIDLLTSIYFIKALMKACYVKQDQDLLKELRNNLSIIKSVYKNQVENNKQNEIDNIKLLEKEIERLKSTN